jgi:hypothetical protein
MFGELAHREAEILDEAKALRSQLEQQGSDEPDAHGPAKLKNTDIDAAFLFRFDRLWYDTAATIRAIMKGLLGQPSDQPLTEQDGRRLIEHLRRNPELTVVDQSVALQATGHYIPLDASDRKALAKGDHGEHDRWLAEAEITIDLLEQLHMLAEAYNLVPHQFETMDWGPNRVELQLRKIAACIASARGTPDLFRWDRFLLVERQRGKGSGPTIRPQRWARRWVPKKTDDAASEDGGAQRQPAPEQCKVHGHTRIRTWTVYYLTKRGGGHRKEQKAIDMWYDVTGDSVDPQNFRAERDRLFDVWITKLRRKSA